MMYSLARVLEWALLFSVSQATVQVAPNDTVNNTGIDIDVKYIKGKAMLPCGHFDLHDGIISHGEYSACICVYKNPNPPGFIPKFGPDPDADIINGCCCNWEQEHVSLLPEHPSMTIWYSLEEPIKGTKRYRNEFHKDIDHRFDVNVYVGSDSYEIWSSHFSLKSMFMRVIAKDRPTGVNINDDDINDLNLAFNTNWRHAGTWNIYSQIGYLYFTLNSRMNCDDKEKAFFDIDIHVTGSGLLGGVDHHESMTVDDHDLRPLVKQHCDKETLFNSQLEL